VSSIDFERRSRAPYGLTLVTSVAHVWFNVFFEGLKSQIFPGTMEDDPADPFNPPQTGAFEVSWEEMDGIKGSSRKGTRAVERITVVWRALGDSKDPQGEARIIPEPPPGEDVPKPQAADWRGADASKADPTTSDLGLKAGTPASGSKSVSKASSVKDLKGEEGAGKTEGIEAPAEGQEEGKEAAEETAVATALKKGERTEGMEEGIDDEDLKGVKSHIIDTDESEGSPSPEPTYKKLKS
jgi:hypothetical protein